MSIRSITFTTLVIGTATFAVGCGGKVESTTTKTDTAVTVALPAHPSPASLCLYAALENGGYAGSGLVVTLSPQANPAAPLEMLGNGRADIAVTTPQTLINQRDGGAPLISVAALTRQTLSYGALKPPGKSAQAKTARLRHASALVGGPNAPAVLVTSRANVSDHGAMLRRFLQATGRACQPTGSAVADGLKAWKKAGGRTRAGKEKASAAALAPNSARGGNPWGWQQPAQWTALVIALQTSGQLRGAIAPDTVFTNEFLAGQGTS